MLRSDQARSTSRFLAIASAIGLGLLTLEASSSDEHGPALRRDRVSNPAVLPPADVVPSPLRHTTDGDETSIAVTLDPILLDQARDAVETTGRVRLGNVVVPGRDSVNLELKPIVPFTNDAVLLAVDADGVERPIDRPTILALGGTVEGDSESDAFISFGPSGVEGWIRVDDVAFGISDGVAGGPILVHRLDALPAIDPEFLEGFCGVDDIKQPFRLMEGRRDDASDPASGGIAGVGPMPCRRIQLAIETDQELLGIFGGDESAAMSYIATLVAATSHIYIRDHNTRVAVNWSRLWTGEDPWDAGGTSAQLTQYRDYWQANMGSVQRDLGHFLSGRGLGGGVAWLSALCSNFNYAVSANLGGSFPYPIENNNGANWDLMVFSHELGHNVGCPHTHDIGVDDCAGGDCSVSPNGTIMSYCHTCPGGLANVRMEFCPENIELANAHINSVPCDFEVTPENIAVNDFQVVEEAVPTRIDVLFNDGGVECAIGNIQSFDPISTAGGTIERLEGAGVDGRDLLLYTSPAGHVGYDFFGYVNRADSIPDAGSVTVQVEGLIPPDDPTGTTPGILGAYYDLADPTALPDFDSLKPFGESIWSRIDSASTSGEFADTGRSDNFGVLWTGWVDLPESGTWTFGTESDDGSRLWIGSQLVVENDGLHGMQERTGSIGLQAGKHAITIGFFERGGGAGCIARASGPGMSYAVIPDEMWSHGSGDAPSGDLNGDGLVNGADLGLLLAGWGEPGPTDLNGDGTTNGADLGLLLAAWSASP
ncbi:MAG: M12 family metallo-peptidase [Phycisphaerales bacterium]|jgi:hypothetical protein|nr:M12 family metallo-peptidase [Phycisphaerales bacterium]